MPSNLATVPAPGTLSVERARVLLAECVRVDEAKALRDQAEAIKIYLRRQGAGRAAEVDAAEIVLRATRRIGELTRELPKAPGARTDQPGPSRGPSKAPALAALGLPKQRASEAERVAAVPAAAFERHVAEQRRAAEPPTVSALLAPIKRAEREARARAEVAQAPLKATIAKAAAVRWLAAIAPASADLLLTDPPYSTDVPDLAAFVDSWLYAALRTVRPGGRAYVCVGSYPVEMHTYLSAALAPDCPMPLADLLVWTYRNTMGPLPRDGYKRNWQAVLYFRGPEAPPLNGDTLTERFSVQDIAAPDGRIGNRYHSWQKPDELAERFVRHASKAGDLVIDPFAGTGTFLLAAAKLGREARGCDLDTAIAIKRGCLAE